MPGRTRSRCLAPGAANRSAFNIPAALRALRGGAQDAGRLSAARARQRSIRSAARARSSRSGLRIFRANGSIASRRARRALRGAAEGAWDVVLATPEFLEFHRDAFTRRQRSVAASWSTRRTICTSPRTAPPTQRSARRSRSLGTPQVLALTATAADAAFARIVESSRSTRGSSTRPCARTCTSWTRATPRDKHAYLVELFAPAGEKGIVYCNSRSGGDQRSLDALRKSSATR